MQTQCVAKAKLVKHPKFKNHFKLIVAFNVTQTNKKGQLMFPVQSKCAYVSGDITIDDLGNTLVTVKKVLRTDNIVIVND